MYSIAHNKDYEFVASRFYILPSRNNLFGTPSPPSVVRQYVVAGTYGFAAFRCWYTAMIDVTLVSVIVRKGFCKILLEPTPKESA
jgi:hypothetical protein